MEENERKEEEIIIADTAPIISLLKIGRLSLLQKLFGSIVIPQSVFNELVCDNRFKDEGQQIRNASYISVVELKNEQLVSLLRRSTGLDLGESEAILLADTYKYSLLLIDEFRGRQVAQQMGIKLMGTVGILMYAYSEQVLTKQEIYDCIDILKVTARRISDKLFQQLIDYLNK